MHPIHGMAIGVNSRLQRSWNFLSAAQMVGIIFGMLGLTFVARPDVGVISYITEQTGISAVVLGLVFVFCGFVITNKPPFKFFAVLVLPYVGYAMYAMWYYLKPGQPLTGVVINFGLVLLILKVYTDEQR